MGGDKPTASAATSGPPETLPKPFKQSKHTIAHAIPYLVTNIATSAAHATAAIVKKPIHGAQQNGFKGALHGAKQGIVTAAAISTHSVLTSVTEIAAAAANTPYHLAATAKGLTYDADKGHYAHYSLQGELNKLREQQPASCTRQFQSTSRPQNAKFSAQESLYVILGLQRDATPSQVRRAYYMRSLETHPDKHPGDDAAAESFSRVAEAYSILSDVQLRAQYDAGGSTAVYHSTKPPDARTMFAMLFGFPAFEPILGRFELADQLESTGTLDPIDLKYCRRRRVIECAAQLATRLDAAVGREEEWIHDCVRFASSLPRSAFGLRLTFVIGRVYTSAALRRLGLSAEASAADLAIAAAVSAGEIWATKLREGDAIKVAISVAAAQLHAESMGREVERAERECEEAEMRAQSARDAATWQSEYLAKDSNNDVSARALESEMARVDLDKARIAVQEATSAKEAAEAAAAVDTCALFWRSIALSVHGVLNAVTQKVLNDHDVSLEARKARARALLILGGIFSAAPSVPEVEEKLLLLPSECEPAQLFALAAGMSGDAIVRNVSEIAATSGLHNEDILISMDGTRVTSYNHAMHLQRSCVQKIGVRRRLQETPSIKSVRKDIAKELGLMINCTNIEKTSGWAARAGRYGGPDHYQFGDLTRSAAKFVGSIARNTMKPRDSLAADEFLPPDRAGFVGKRSGALKQWRIRWFELRGSELTWARPETMAEPHGCISLDGMHVIVDDFESGRCFTLRIETDESASSTTSPTLTFACSSMAESQAWRYALEYACARSE